MRSGMSITWEDALDPASLSSAKAPKVSILLVGEDHCSDTRYLERLTGREAQHTALETAFEELRVRGQYTFASDGLYRLTHTSNIKTMNPFGIDHTAADTLARRRPGYTLVSAHTTLKSKRFPERWPHRQTRSRPHPHRDTFFVTA